MDTYSQQGKKNEEINDSLENRDFDRVLKHLYNTIFKVSKNASGNYIFTLSEGLIAEKLGMTTRVFKNKEINEVFPADVAKIMEVNCKKAFEGLNTNFEIELGDYYFLVYLSPIIEEERVFEVVGTAIDITERKRAEDKIRKLAYYDLLTNLPNRRSLEEYVQKMIKDERTAFGILFLDLDQFKKINDTFGHYFGDKLLIAVSNRIKSVIGNNECIFRHGGDEFIIVLPEMNRKEVALTVQRMVEVMNRSFIIDNEELFSSISVGGAMYPEDGDSLELLMKRADSAMYSSKEKGINKFKFYRKSFDLHLRKRIKLETELRRAIELNEWELFYQPQVNIKTGKIIGTEALIRWEHPKLGRISPEEFIPIAEDTELILPIGAWVLENVCKQFKLWHHSGCITIPISVNVSQLQFNQSDFVISVIEILDRYNMSSDNLEFEITESIMADFHWAERVLKSLHKEGIKISIDDFGTGYSSLSYLSRLPIDKIKMDQSFLNPLNSRNKAIIKTIVSLTKNLNLELIAEGVENADQASFLLDQNCTLAQGYYYGKPLTAGMMGQWLKH